ncbi:Lnb N-terminal periplasmic domain-containing protein [Treponema porcinum]|uniref:Lnb N-terminal periplasmic domain-containing protein n=1 Tax=Treponema porcinum TaxID=261392 RepID=UPI003F0D4BAD
MKVFAFKTGDFKKTVSCFFIFFIFLCFSFSGFAQNNNDGFSYSQKADEIIIIAENLNLSADSYWHTLLHYKPAAFHKVKSLVDAPNFFCAADGKTNPKSELNATIQAFFEPEKSDGTQHAIERFPGRYKWLCRKLNLSEGDFPYNGDRKYQEKYAELNPGNVYLVFSSGYLKRPASVFGHTFLLIESKHKPLLSAPCINYGAVTNIKNGFLYSLLGLFGGFRGYYGFEPYYKKIKQYADIDMRDMWEYKLNLTADETDSLLRHVFDLQNIYSKYFFISENCSFNLLFLIEAARPETNATSKLNKIVEPVETVKLIHSLGMTENPTYRPSLYSKIKQEKKNLSGKQQKYIKDICLGKKSAEDFPFSDSSTETQARIWDMAADYLSALLSSGKITAEEYRPRFLSVLTERNRLDAEYSYEAEQPDFPENAHGSKKTAFSSGKDFNGFYAGLNFRLSAHEQLEKPAGYSENSEVSFFQTDIRFYPENNDFLLNNLLFLSVISLPSSDSFFFNGAMKFQTGLETLSDNNNKDFTVWKTTFLYGASVIPVKQIQLYAMAGGILSISPKYKYNTDICAGAEAGVITTTGIWKNKISSQTMLPDLYEKKIQSVFSVNSCLYVSQNTALKADCSFSTDYKDFSFEYSFSFNMYF